MCGGGDKMKKIFLGTLLLASVITVPIPAMGGVDVSVSIALPPIVFPAPPALIVLPETYIYVVPDVDVDIFFYGGWWWRPWEGRWYRSRYYDSGWVYYRSVPSFYAGIPPGWRNDYREHRWRGHPWNYQRIPHQQVQRNWRDWEKSRHWERQQTWGVQGLQPRTRAQQPPREVKPRQFRPQLREVKPEGSPQHREAGPQFREGAKPQHREAGPQFREGPKPQHREGGPQPKEGKPRRPQKQQDDQERGKLRSEGPPK